MGDDFVDVVQLEMEMQKLETQTDYWLAQYQRLLDSKPQCLIDQVVSGSSSSSGSGSGSGSSGSGSGSS